MVKLKRWFNKQNHLFLLGERAPGSRKKKLFTLLHTLPPLVLLHQHLHALASDMQQPTAATDKAIILIATKSPIHIININYIINWSTTDHQLDHWLHQLHHQLITPSYIISWRMESIQESSHYDVSKNYEKKKYTEMRQALLCCSEIW